MRNRKSWVILLAAALLAISCFAAVFADDAVPGTAADPVVSKSYMDAQIDILTTQISALQARIDKLEEGGGSTTPATPSTPDTPAQPAEAPEGKKTVRTARRTAEQPGRRGRQHGVDARLSIHEK